MGRIMAHRRRCGLSPFGQGVPGVLEALQRPVPSETDLSNAELEGHIRLVLSALQNKIGELNMRPAVSRARAATDTAHVTMVEQGLRLFVLERILNARGLPLPSEMSNWLRTLRMSAPIMEALRGMEQR